MMEKIGDFIFKSNASSFSISYNRNSKDIFDIFISGVISLVLIGFTILVFYGLYTEGFSWLQILIFIIFLFVCVLKTSIFISLVFQPIKNIIKYDSEIEKVTIRNSFFKKTILKYSDLHKIEYQFYSKDVTYDSNVRKTSYWLEVSLITKKQEKIRLFNINYNEILDNRKELIIRNILGRARPIIKKTAQLLSIESRFIRGIIEDN